ncbi:MAG: hypothetical protein J5552_05180 [Prevotella sp.]|nr:hypothetical protein [Prevotella sp.]
MLTIGYGCHHETPSPLELLMADSAYMQGNYRLGDALLDKCAKNAQGFTDADRLYFQLIRFEQMFLGDELTIKNLDTADSLCRYYQGVGDEYKHAKAMLFKGGVYLKEKNYPEALNCFLNVRTYAEEHRDIRLLYMTDKRIGDLYFSLQMYEECVPYYRQSYALAVANHDTLRTAYGAFSMGNVSMIEDNYDSTIHYFQESIRLGSMIEQKERIVPIALQLLCDIYIQGSEYDKAAELMPHDTLNTANWAYWHLAQNHLDSAFFYFRQTLGRFKWQGEAEVLRAMAQIEQMRGNPQAALSLYEEFAAAKDSMFQQQRTEETMRIKAQYDNSKILKQRDELDRQNRERLHFIWLMVVIVIAVVVMLLAVVRIYRLQKETATVKLRMMEKEKDENEASLKQQIEENNRKLATLREEQAKARQQGNEHTMAQYELETIALENKNRSIEAMQQRKEALLHELYEWEVYKRLKSSDPQTEKKMDEADWMHLRQRLDNIYDQFTKRLLSHASLSETELHICYLLKINVPPVDIATIMFKSKSAITMARKRMYQKFYGKSGSAEELDELIAQM